MSTTNQYRVCNHPGCPTLTPRLGPPSCPSHRRETKRSSGTSKPYDHQWTKIAKEYMRFSPNCELCLLLGKRKKAVEVDHKIEIVDGGTNDWSNLQALCKSHHARKTAYVRRLRLQGGG